MLLIKLSRVFKDIMLLLLLLCHCFQQAAQQPPKTDELDRLGRQADELLERSRERRANYKLIDSEIIKQNPEPVPAAYKDVSTATWQFSTQSFSPRSVVSVNGAREDILKDDKPRSIMKRRELESREQMMYPSNQSQAVVEHNKYQRSHSNVVAKPTITETVQRFEETRRTEEIERRVQRKERRERRSRHHSSSRHQSGREGYDGGYYTGARSSSLSRGHNGYLPSSHEQYTRQVTTRRDHESSGGRYEDEQFGRGIAHARYGSLSDSLRRGELKYIPNGDVRENYAGQHSGQHSGQRSMHKSYSTRDVFSGGDGYDRRSVSSHRRGSQQMSPFVEFPPTLPRRYHQDDMGRLETEFRDSLLMPMPRGNMNERDFRHENIPGGYETYQKENYANSGRRMGRDGHPVDFHEATQEYNFKREQELADRRR